MDQRICATTARTWLDRRSQRRNRVSLGGRTPRALRRNRGRVPPAQGRCLCHGGNPTSPRGKAGDIRHPDRLCSGGRRGWHWSRRKFGAAGRQCHWPGNPGADLAGKRLELLREVVPGLGRLAILGNVGNPLSVLELGEVRAAARALGLEGHTLEIRRGQDIAPAFEALKGQADALYVCIDGLVNTNRIRINTSALGARLPTMHGAREYVEAGGLMSYGANYPDLFRRSADYVDKILHGAKPGDLPVELPTKFDLIINLTTAKTLGLEVPPTLLARADEVIE